MKLQSLSVLVMFAASTAVAQTLPDYRCRIDRVATSDRSPNSQFDFMAKNYIGKEFTVDRRTGVMTGALRNAFITRPDPESVTPKPATAWLVPMASTIAVHRPLGAAALLPRCMGRLS